MVNRGKLEMVRYNTSKTKEQRNIDFRSDRGSPAGGGGCPDL